MQRQISVPRCRASQVPFNWLANKSVFFSAGKTRSNSYRVGRNVSNKVVNNRCPQKIYEVRKLSTSLRKWRYFRILLTIRPPPSSQGSEEFWASVVARDHWNYKPVQTKLLQLSHGYKKRRSHQNRWTAERRTCAKHRRGRIQSNIPVWCQL